MPRSMYCGSEPLTYLEHPIRFRRNYGCRSIRICSVISQPNSISKNAPVISRRFAVYSSISGSRLRWISTHPSATSGGVTTSTKFFCPSGKARKMTNPVPLVLHYQVWPQADKPPGRLSLPLVTSLTARDRALIGQKAVAKNNVGAMGIGYHESSVISPPFWITYRQIASPKMVCAVF